MVKTMTRRVIAAARKRQSARYCAPQAAPAVWALALVILFTAPGLAFHAAVERVAVAIAACVEGVLAVFRMLVIFRVTLFVFDCTIVQHGQGGHRAKVRRLVFSEARLF